MKYFLLIIATLSMGFAQVKVAVASNTIYVMEKLQKEFNKNHPNIQIDIVLGSSGKLRAQIEHGAPFDIFMSANDKYANYLVDKNLTKGKAVVYARGELILYSSKGVELLDGIKALTKSSIKKIAIANPKTAPYGAAAKESLINANIFGKVKSKLVYAQNIAQAFLYSKRAVDVGFIAKSALFSKELKGAKEGIDYIVVPKNLYRSISQSMVLLSVKKGAKEFFYFLQSPKAKEIFKEYGYLE